MNNRRIGCCIAVVSLILSMFCGCATIPPEYREAHDRVMEKTRIAEHKKKTHNCQLFFYYRPLDQQTWKDVTFDNLEPEILRRIYNKLKNIAEEEKQNYGFWNEVVFRKQQTFLPIIRLFTAENVKRQQQVADALEELIAEYTNEKTSFDNGKYNVISYMVWGIGFSITPSYEGDQKRIKVVVFDSGKAALTYILIGNETIERCEFLCNYRGQILKTMPERKSVK